MITAAIAFTTLTLMALSGHIAASAPRGSWQSGRIVTNLDIRASTSPLTATRMQLAES